MKFKSIKAKIIVLMSGATAIILLAIILYVAITEQHDSIQNSQVFLEAQAKQLALKVESELEVGLRAVQTMAHSMESFKRKENSAVNRAVVINLIANVLIHNEMAIASGNIWEPNSFDGKDSAFRNEQGHDASGRFLPYLAKDGKGTLSLAPLEGFETEGDGDWYLIPKRTKREVLTNPYLYPVHGRDVLMITLSAPIIVKGEFLGVSTADIDISFIQKYIQERLKGIYHGEGAIEIIANNGIYAASTIDSTRIGHSFSEFNQQGSLTLQAIQQGETKVLRQDNRLVVCVPLAVGRTESPWQVRVSVPEHIILREARANTLTILTIGLLGLVLVLIIIRLITKSITRPLTEGVNLAKRISEGDLTHKIPVNSQDEIGQLAAALNRMVRDLQTFIRQVKEGADSVTLASGQIRDTSYSLSEGAHNQASSVEKVSSTITEIVTKVEQNAHNSQITAKKSAKVHEDVLVAGERSEEFVQANNLINDKITIIKDIAHQTDILALNAAVEAARAGEHGRGFAVVAAEVRKLAERSKDGAEEIINLFTQTKASSDSAGNSLQLLIPEIEHTSKLVRDLLDEISTASVEQREGIEQVGAAIQRLSQIAKQTSTTSEELASTSGEMTAQAEKLQELVASFRID